MKKHHRTKLRVVREAVRALHSHELQQVEGGEALSRRQPCPNLEPPVGPTGGA